VLIADPGGLLPSRSQVDRLQTSHLVMLANEIVSMELLGPGCLLGSPLILDFNQDLIHSGGLQFIIVRRGCSPDP